MLDGFCEVVVVVVWCWFRKAEVVQGRRGDEE
jgi:hypothetical protein